MTITTAKRGDLTLPVGIVPVGTGRISGGLERASAAVLALVGLAPASLCTAPIATVPLDPRVVLDLHAYAVRQLESAAGMEALRVAGLDHADIVAAYKPGYLPAGYRDLLPVDQRPHFDRAWKGNALLLPAYDAQGVIVDLLACAPTSRHVARSLWTEPRGMLAPVLATAFKHLVVTDTPCRLGRLMRDGIPPLLLRGPADAHANVGRLAAGGVCSVEVHTHRDGEAIRATLAGAGICVSVVRPPGCRTVRSEAIEPEVVEQEVVEPSPASAHGEADDGADQAASAPVPLVAGVPAAETASMSTVVSDIAPSESMAVLPTLVLVEHDRQGERAVFRFGAGSYTVTLPHRPTSTLAVVVTGPKRSQSASFDLGVEQARRRIGAMLAISTGLPGIEVAAALVALLPAVMALVEPVAPVTLPLNPITIPMRENERDEAMTLLRSGDLVERVGTALGHLGADSADPATTLAVLAAISRLSDRPLWLVLSATMPDERFPALAAIAQATPPDQIVHVSRLTAEALNHHDPEALRHKLLLLGDATEISERAATSLRLLHDRGVLTTATVERSTQYGGLRTKLVEVHGPIAVLSAATTTLRHGLAHHLFSVPVDDSPEAQTRQRQAAVAPMADPGVLAATQRRRAAAIGLLHNAQRLLIPRPVAIPDLAVDALPAAFARSRLHHDTLIGLIQASALLHQHQRPTAEGCVVATTADTDLAVRLLHHVATLQSAGMSRQAHRILTALWASGRMRFTMDDLDVLLPGWTRWAFRVALDELVTLDVVAAGRGGRGKRREYTVVAAAPRATALRMPVPVATPECEVAHG